MPLPGTPVGGEHRSRVSGPSVLEKQPEGAAGVPVKDISLGVQHQGSPLPGTPVDGERKSTISGPGPIDSILEQQPQGAAGVPVPETSLRGQHQGPVPGGHTLGHKGLAPRVQPAHGRLAPITSDKTVFCFHSCTFQQRKFPWKYLFSHGVHPQMILVLFDDLQLVDISL